MFNGSDILRQWEQMGWMKMAICCQRYPVVIAFPIGRCDRCGTRPVVI